MLSLQRMREWRMQNQFDKFEWSFVDISVIFSLRSSYLIFPFYNIRFYCKVVAGIDCWFAFGTFDHEWDAIHSKKCYSCTAARLQSIYPVLFCKKIGAGTHKIDAVLIWGN